MKDNTKQIEKNMKKNKSFFSGIGKAFSGFFANGNPDPSEDIAKEIRSKQSNRVTELEKMFEHVETKPNSNSGKKGGKGNSSKQIDNTKINVNNKKSNEREYDGEER